MASPQWIPLVTAQLSNFYNYLSKQYDADLCQKVEIMKLGGCLTDSNTKCLQYALSAASDQTPKSFLFTLPEILLTAVGT